MKIEYLIHEDERGGYWAEVPAIPGCVTQGETLEELAENVKDAAEGCLAVIFEDFSRNHRQSVAGGADSLRTFGGNMSIAFRPLPLNDRPRRAGRRAKAFA